MTISAIITRGYGSFAGLKYVPTRGYIAGIPIAPPVFQIGTKGEKTDPVLFEVEPDFETINRHDALAILLLLN